MNKKLNPIVGIIAFVFALLGTLLYAFLEVGPEDASLLIRQAIFFVVGGIAIVALVIWQQKKRKKVLNELEKLNEIVTDHVGNLPGQLNRPQTGLNAYSSVGISIGYSKGARLSLSNPDILDKLNLNPGGEITATGDMKAGAVIGVGMLLVGAFFFYLLPAEGHWILTIWISVCVFMTAYTYLLSQKLVVNSSGIFSDSTSMFGRRSLRFPRTETLSIRTENRGKRGKVSAVYLDVVGANGSKCSFQLFADPNPSVAEAIKQRISEHLKLSKAS